MISYVKTDVFTQCVNSPNSIKLFEVLNIVWSYLKHAMFNMVVIGIDRRGSLMGFGWVQQKKAKAFPKTISASNQVAEEAPWQELPPVAPVARQVLAKSCHGQHVCCMSFVFQPKLLSLIICFVETLNRDSEPK